MKDLTEVVLEDRKKDQEAGDVEGENACDFQCPVTGLEMNGRFRFFCVLPSGHAVSHRAVKEAREVVEELVGATFSSAAEVSAAAGKEGGALPRASLLPINGTDEEVRALRQEALLRRGKKGGKKKKKTKGKGAMSRDKGLQAKPKPFKAAESMLPKGASKEVYASIFTSSKKEETKETFLCRSVSARGGQLS